MMEYIEEEDKSENFIYNLKKKKIASVCVWSLKEIDRSHIEEKKISCCK